MTATETDHAAFIRAICEDPDSNAPRLVYCDWLEEQSNHMCWQRALFIRRLIGGGYACPTNVADTYEYDQTIPDVRSIAWIDGFIGRIEINFDDWMEHGKEIVLSHPIREVQITNKWPTKFATVDRWYFSTATELPEEWFGGEKEEYQKIKVFTSEQESCQWLNAKCLSHARDLAGIYKVSP